ncbi:MAG: DNA polymerase III subunit delta' [Phycisphaerae bacterium]|nr:DNA polymerase III subunit delta' [Phycisphaerae bacterium]MDW8261900.1 DNA polymerase III subunit delta' [Phycisphaerales bacterium]
MHSLDSILGQDSAVNWLRSSLAAGRLPHGMIFAGPPGVGKATTAEALAGVVLCPEASQQRACGQCASCRALAAGSHPDFHRVYRQLARFRKDEGGEEPPPSLRNLPAARDLSVKVIREYLLERAALTSVLGRGKVFLVEEAELMSISAQNALLKTLEEPPLGTLIILNTSNPQLLLPTIRSRCQLVKFSPLSESLLRQELTRRGFSPEEAAAAARITAGSLGLSLRWQEDGVIAAAQELARRIDRLPESAVDLATFLKESADDYAEKQLARDEHASKDQVTREGAVVLLNAAAEHLRRRLGETADPEKLQQLCHRIEAAITTERYIDSNVTLALALEQFAAAIAH